MVYEVVVKIEAAHDVLDAYIYYESKLLGLGERFLSSIVLIYEKLAANPQYYSFISADREQGFRDVKVKGFPFVVLFQIIGSDVVVFAVHNTHSKGRI